MVEGRFDNGGDVGIKGEVAVKKYTKALYCGGWQQQTVSEGQGSYIEILKLSFRSYQKEFRFASVQLKKIGRHPGLDVLNAS